MNETISEKKKINQQRLDYLNAHGRPVSRREFVARGLTASAGFMLVPSIATSLLNNAIAREWGAKSFDLLQRTEPKFVVFDLVGGAALCGNFLFGKSGGPKDLLASYSMLGWNPRVDRIDERFGLPMPDADKSKILEGILSVLSEDAQAKFRMGSMLHTSNLDTASNPLSAANAIAKVSQLKKSIQNPIGFLNTLSGGYSRGVISDPNFRALYINSFDSLVGAIAPAKVLRDLSALSLERIMHTAKNLSVSQSKRFLGNPLTEVQFKNIQNHFDIATENMSKNPSNEMDPRKDVIISKLYGLEPSTSTKSKDLIRAALVMNHLKGIAGPAVITIEGCDYHDGSSQSGDTKDREIGVEIGRVVESAHLMGVPLFVQIITDGGIYADGGTRNWRGDSVESGTILGYFSPDSTPEYSSNGLQLGAFTDGQGVHRSTLIGQNPGLAAYATVVNYLTACGTPELFQKVYPGVFSNRDLDNVQIFASNTKSK